MNENDPKNFAWYIKEYKGAIIGGLIALVFIATGLSTLLFGLVVIILGVIIGHYVQKNKDKVKQTLKEFIDKF